jgi:hypothetical protein
MAGPDDMGMKETSARLGLRERAILVYGASNGCGTKAFVVNHAIQRLEELVAADPARFVRRLADAPNRAALAGMPAAA